MQIYAARVCHISCACAQNSFLGGDEVKFKCFDEDPGVVTWMQQHCEELGCCGNQAACSLSMLSYFFDQMQTRVMAKLPVKRAMGVWLADAGNAARGCASNPLVVGRTNDETTEVLS